MEIFVGKINKYLNFYKIKQKNLILYLWWLLPFFLMSSPSDAMSPGLVLSGSFVFVCCVHKWYYFKTLNNYIPCFKLAGEGFDPPTSGLWAQHASSASPRFFLCVVKSTFYSFYFFLLVPLFKIFFIKKTLNCFVAERNH